MRDEARVENSFTRHFLRQFEREGMLTINELDGNGRIIAIYEAHVGVETGDGCLKTELKYEDGAGGTSRRVTATRERIVAWPGFGLVGATDPEDFDTIP